MRFVGQTFRRAVIVLPLLLSAGAALASFSRTGDAQVKFTAIGPAGLKIEGQTKEISAREEGDILHISVPVQTLTTGIDLRDKHMKEKYLEVAKYATSELLVRKADLKVPADGARGSAAVTGKLTLHGTSRDVEVRYDAVRTGTQYKVTGKTSVNIKDFNIEVPSYLGVSVKPDVDINVTFELNDK